MKVSIITPTFNSASTIKDCLKSVSNQDYEDIEHLIIDGKSSDETIDIVNKHKTYNTTLISEPDNGLYSAINKGIALSTGDILGILNSDDMYYDYSVISNIVKYFKKYKIKLSYGDLVIVDRNNINKTKRIYTVHSNAKLLFRFGMMPPHPTVFIKSDLYNKYGHYSEKYIIAADYEFLFRQIMVNNVAYKYIPMPIVLMRNGGISNNGIKSSFRLNKEIYTIHKELGIPISVFSLIKKIPIRIKERFKKY